MENVRKHILSGEGGIYCCSVGAMPRRSFRRHGYLLHTCCRTEAFNMGRLAFWHAQFCMPNALWARLLCSRHWDKVRREKK